MSPQIINPPSEVLDHLAQSSPLRHLEWFNRPFEDANEYWHASQYLLYGGWPELIKQYFYESPIPKYENGSANPAFSPMLIFPGDELGARRIDPVPLTYSANLTIGDLVLKTAWARGLSFRLVYIQSGSEGQEIPVLKFVKRHETIPYNISVPPEITFVDQMLLLPNDTQKLDFPEADKNRGPYLYELIDKITMNDGKFAPFKDSIVLAQDLRNLFVKLNFLESQSLVEILDAATHYLDAIWEWGSNKETRANIIRIAPASGSTTIASRLKRSGYLG